MKNLMKKIKGQWEYRKGKTISDINLAVQKGLKLGRGKTEREIDCIAMYLETVLKKVKAPTKKGKINMTFLVKVENTDDETIAGLLEYGTVDDILVGNICIMTADKESKDKIKLCYGVLSVEEDEDFKAMNK